MTKEELEKYLSTDVPDTKGKRAFIWGTGSTAQLYQEGFRRLGKGGLEIEGYCDNHPKDTFGKVASPADLYGKKDVIVFICSLQPAVVSEVAGQLEDGGVAFTTIDDYIFKSHKKEIMQVYGLLDDEYSKEVYSELVRLRTEAQYPDEKYVTGDPYFCLAPFKRADQNEIFVDCGAWVGDSIEKYITVHGGAVKKIIAFEPDETNARALQCRVQRLKQEWNLPEGSIEIARSGVGEKSAEGTFISYGADHGLGSRFSSQGSGGGTACGIVSLDDYIRDPVTFIKADIEGCEYGMLMGGGR